MFDLKDIMLLKRNLQKHNVLQSISSVVGLVGSLPVCGRSGRCLVNCLAI